MIYKIGIISKRYLIIFGILRWHRLYSYNLLLFGHRLCTRRLIARTCKVFRFARKLSTAPADLESTPRVPQRVGLGLGVRVRVWVRVRVRVGSEVGLIWAAQPSFRADLHIRSRYT